MKSNLLLKLSIAACMLISVSSCKSNTDEDLPKVSDVATVYSANNLKVAIEGSSAEISKDAKVEIKAGSADNKATIVLSNIVPGAAEVVIPEAEFSSATKSSFVSTVKGEVNDNVAGYNVKVVGTIDNGVLSVHIVLKEIPAVDTDTAPLQIMSYKGKMGIDVQGTVTTIDQRIYLAKATDPNPSMIKLTIKDFSLKDLSLGDIALDNILVQKRGDVFTFKAKGIKLDLDKMKNLTIDLNGTINGSEIKLNLNIAVAADLNVIVAFEGDASLEFTFKEWEKPEGMDYTDPKDWATSNLAGLFLPLYGIIVPMPVVEVESENAAKITTSRTVSTTQPNTLVPGVTAGTLFLGTFKIDMDNTLKSTLFGVPYALKPTTFKVTYKYAPGAIFYKTVVKEDSEGKKYNDTEVVTGESDKCSICAYLYEVTKYSETLDGSNIKKNDLVILKAILSEGSTNGTYKDATIQFESTGKGTFDATKKYKLAIVCSSSERGDEFMGADGSALSITKLVIE